MVCNLSHANWYLEDEPTNGWENKNVRFLCALSTRVKSGKNAGLGTGVTLLGEVWASLPIVISVKRGRMTLSDTTSIFHMNSENEVFYHGLRDRRSEATGTAVPCSSLMCPLCTQPSPLLSLPLPQKGVSGVAVGCAPECVLNLDRVSPPTSLLSL